MATSPTCPNVPKWYFVTLSAVCGTVIKELLKEWGLWPNRIHYTDNIASVMASQITGISIVYSTVCSGADQRKHQSSASLAPMRGIHRWPVSSPHKGPVTRKMFPFDDVIMKNDSSASEIIRYHKDTNTTCIALYHILLCIQYYFISNTVCRRQTPLAAYM